MIYNPRKIDPAPEQNSVRGKKKMAYNPGTIEKRWQRVWERTGIYKAPDKIKGKKNFYHLVMFPYPSGDLHIGHWYNFAPADVYGRFKRMQGFNTMSPIGFDAFGLPAENAAIRHRIHPRIWTYKNIKTMRRQLKSMGTIYDWSREVITCDPEYYKWTQWMFLQLYKKGLAYRARVPANFCLSCKTVLANEQVIDGKCERCGAKVIQKEIKQWLLKITAYADDLISDLEDLDWPETTKIMQRNWIGKSEGAEISFQIKDSKHQVPVFTTRADTLFGTTYLVLAPEHPILKNLESRILNFESVKKYIEESEKKTELERISERRQKTGIEVKGIKAINPANKKEIPLWVADYVLMGYATGAIMGVPAHDQRDFDFARSHHLPVVEVIKPKEEKTFSSPKASPITSAAELKKAYEEEGYLVNSGRFNRLNSKIAHERIVLWLAKKGLAQEAVCYKLRDWIISRQRYWGTPIPMIFCERCGWVPVPERDLPVLLPTIKDFRPTGEGKSPLARSKKFVNTLCPKCKRPAKRETDTMDTFVCSSWYYLRYVDSRNKKRFARLDKIKTWLPVDMYIGGREHIVLHLLYSRFFTKALRDLGYINFKEPFLSLRHQGIILGPDGRKMSKSKGNVIDPDPLVKKYGTDAVRMYLCFMGPYGKGGSWQLKGINGISRFLEKVWVLEGNLKSDSTVGKRKQDKGLEKLIHKTIKKVGEDIENFRFNTAVSALMILVNKIQKETQVGLKDLRTLLLILAPFAPHLSEELWFKIRKKTEGRLRLSELKKRDSVHNQEWPKYNPQFIKEEKINLVIQINGKVRDQIEVEAVISQKEAKNLALSQERIKKWVKGKEIRKTIFVPGKLINIVV